MKKTTTHIGLFCCLLSLVLVMALVLCACGNKTNNVETNNENLPDSQTEMQSDTDQKDAALSKIVNDDGEEFVVDLTKNGKIETSYHSVDSNIIRLYGKEYEMPVKISVLLDDGWYFSENLEFDDSFEPKAKTNLVSFELLKDDGKQKIYLRSIYNDSDEAKSIKDCLLVGAEINVDGWRMSDTVFPGGICTSSMAKDVLDVYGNPNSNNNFKSGYNGEKQLSYFEQKESGISYTFVFEEESYEDIVEGSISAMIFDCMDSY